MLLEDCKLESQDPMVHLTKEKEKKEFYGPELGMLGNISICSL